MAASEFANEAALCAAFLDWVKREAGGKRYGVRAPKWTAYPETAGWDMLLVAEDGTQLGVQAKMQFNMKVLAQAMPDERMQCRDQGPDFRAILVPKADEAQHRICANLGLALFTHFPAASAAIMGGGPPAFQPGLDFSDQPFIGHTWHYWSPRERCAVPEYVPDVVAGAPAPVQLTAWKIKALRLLALLELRGYVTREDFKNLKMDHRSWVKPNGWLRPGAGPGQFVRGTADFDTQHAAVYPQVLADERGRYVPPAPADQAALL